MKYYRWERGKKIVPVSMEEWSAQMNNPDSKRVAETNLGIYWISTVFLGMDHSFGGTGDPVLFETMVFKRGMDREINFNDIECRRYCTEEEAIKGHADMVSLMRKRGNKRSKITPKKSGAA